MAWVNGVQPRVYPENINEQISKIEGYLEEKDAQFWLYKFLRANPALAVYVLMGVQLLPFQQIIIKGMMQNDYTLAILSRSAGKTWLTGVFVGLYALLNPGVHIGIISATFRQCAHPDTWLYTNRGLVQLKDANVGDMVYSIDGPNKILNKWANPISTGKKITTKHNFSFSGKNGHKVYRYIPESLEFEYANIEDVKKGDYLALHKNVNSFGDNDFFENLEYGEDFAYLLGLIVGDGHVGRCKSGSKYTITTADQETIDFLKALHSVVNPDRQLSIREKPNSRCKSVCLNSNHFVDFLNYAGLKNNVTATFKTVPHLILSAQKKYVREFLKGLMDTDGTIYFNEKKGYCIIDFCTSSKQMAEQVQLMFLNFGIVSRMATEKARGAIKIMGVDCYGRESYKVRITGVESVRTFAKELGFRLTRKQAALNGYLSTARDKGNYDCVPDIGTFITKNSRGNKRLPHTLGKKRINNFLETRISSLFDGAENKIRSVLEKDFHFERVEAVEDLSVESIDIEVENEHCYVGNGFVHHNSKEVMKKLINVSKSPKAKFLAECMTSRFAPDEWNIEIGTSKITALPLGDGQRLRGFRFQMMVIDELLLMPQSIIDEVITPFLAGVTNPVERKKTKEIEDKLVAKGLMKDSERKTWPANKMIGLSSASYKFEYLYRLYQSYEKSICGVKGEDEEDQEGFKDARKFIAHISYDALPKELFDEKVVQKSRNEMSTSQFNREYNAEFTSDSAGYYKISKLKDCRFEPGKGQDIELVGEKGAEYILAVDPNAAGNEDSDDFAMQVFKILDKASNKVCLVHSYAVAGADLKSHANYFSYLVKNFNIVFIAFDNAGGPTTMSFWNEFPEIKKLGYEFKVIDVPFNDQTLYFEELTELRRQYNQTDKKICYLRVFDNTWQRVANELLQGCVEHKRIRFAGGVTSETYNQDVPASIDIDNLLFQSESGTREKTAGRAKFIEFADNIELLISRTIEQCALIEIAQTDTGQQRFVLPANLRKQRGQNKTRKDSFSALVLGNWACKIYLDMIQRPAEDAGESFVPCIF